MPADGAHPGDSHTRSLASPAGRRRVASVEVGPERETPRGWAHAVTVRWMVDSESTHDVRLSWADHDHLSGGACPPSKVAGAVARIAAESLGAGKLPAKFDVSTVRRLIAEMDERVQAML